MIQELFGHEQKRANLFGHEQQNVDLFGLGQQKADQIALMGSNGISVTYGDLVALKEQMRGLFSHKSLVFCMCRNEPGSAAGYVAMLECGMVPVLLDGNGEYERLEQIFRTYEPEFIWAPQGWTADEWKGIRVFEVYGYVLWKLETPACEMHPDLALLLTTSGSTGDPKLVRLSYENLLSNASAISQYLKLDENCRPITTLPMYYTYGLSVIHSHLLVGATILMTGESYVQAGFWEFLEREGATSLSGVPYTYEILRRMRVFRNQYSSLKQLTQAGGALSVALQEQVTDWARKLGASFYIMYGQTEATARMAYLPWEDVERKPGSIGKAIPGGVFHLLDENGQVFSEPERTGELVYSGPNVSLGYALTRADLSKGDENQGVLHTGDLAKMDAEGYYYIVGRKKRYLKVYGNRISLDACEGWLRAKHPQFEIACDGAEDLLKLYVVSADTNETDTNETDTNEADTDEVNTNEAETLAEELAEYLNLSYKAVQGISIVQMPKNEAGKILYSKLKQ